MQAQDGSMRWRRIRGQGVLVGAAVAGIAGIASRTHAAPLANVVFDDTLATNGSTLNGASQSYPNTASPTSTWTNYDVASNKDASLSALNPGSPLQLEMVATSSGVNSAEALFTSSPVMLVNVNDSVEATVTFTVASTSVAPAEVFLTLASSGGSAPYNNMFDGTAPNAGTDAAGNSAANLTGLGNSNVNDSTGGVQNYVGYEGQAIAGSKTKEFSRPAQATNSSNLDQALTGASYTGGYPTDTAATYTSQTNDGPTFTAGSTFTDELEVTLSAAGTYTLTESVYAGASDTGTALTSAVGTLASLPSGGFDALAFGYRANSSGSSSELDVSSVEVTTTVNVPEPVSMGLMLLMSELLITRRRRRS